MTRDDCACLYDLVIRLSTLAKLNPVMKREDVATKAHLLDKHPQGAQSRS